MGDLSGLAGQPIEVNLSQSNDKRAKQEFMVLSLLIRPKAD